MIDIAESVGLKTGITRLLRPASVAIVGASDKTGSLGASVLTNLETSNYAGPIYLINPKRTEIAGRTCLASVSDLPFGVDCAVLAIPKAGILDAVKSCAAQGVGAAIIFSAGFAEAGTSGKIAQEELTRISTETGMIIQGPNCLGMVNAIEGIPLTFVTTPKVSPSGNRRVGVVSQSGAMAAVLGVSLRKYALDLSYSISTGNEASSGVEDYLQYLLDDSHTSVIALLVEQFRKPRQFLELASKARNLGKQIVLLHPGSSSAARASAATHTGAIAGDYEIMQAKVRDAGVIVAETLEELIDVSHLLVRCPHAASHSAVVITESGAFKALTLDLCERIGLPLPQLSSAAISELRAVLPDFIPPSNPLDVTAQGLVDPDLYHRILPPLLADEHFGSIVLTMILTDHSTVQIKLPPLLDALSKFDLKKPFIFAALDEGAPIDEAYITRLRELGIPFFPTAERAFRALARITPPRNVARSQDHFPPAREERLPHGALNEYESKIILRTLGLPMPPGDLAPTLDAAIEIAQQINYPVVLKAQSNNLHHKTEAGGVILTLRTEEELREGWARLHVNLGRFQPGLKLDGVLVEKMSEPGIEFIVGAKNDPEWGPVVMIGLGGVFAEALHDVRILAPDLPVEEVIRELGSLKGSKLLKGFRGSPPPDVAAIAQIVQNLGRFVMGHPEIKEIDLNPVVAHPQGAVVLDALIICS